jgi:hypothetical protein
MQRGGHSFHHAQHIEETGHSGTGFAFARDPLAHRKHGNTKVGSAPGFVKVQAFEGVPDTLSQ